MTREDVVAGLKAAERFGHPALIEEWRAALAEIDRADEAALDAAMGAE